MKLKALKQYRHSQYFCSESLLLSGCRLSDRKRMVCIHVVLFEINLVNNLDFRDTIVVRDLGLAVKDVCP